MEVLTGAVAEAMGLSAAGEEGVQGEGKVASAPDREEAVWPVAPWVAAAKGISAGSMGCVAARLGAIAFRAGSLRV